MCSESRAQAVWLVWFSLFSYELSYLPSPNFLFSPKLPAQKMVLPAFRVGILTSINLTEECLRDKSGGWSLR